MDNHASRSRQPSFAGSQRSVSNHSVAKSRTSRSPSVERQGFGGSHRSFGASHQDIGDELGYQVCYLSYHYILRVLIIE